MAGREAVNDDWRLVCDHCRDVIGAYEPFWLRHPGRGWIRTSWLALEGDPDQPPPDAPVFHLACRPAAAE